MQKVCGAENVGLGTDFTQGQDAAFFAWLRHDKGYARRVMPGTGTAPFVPGLETLADYPNLVPAPEARGGAEARLKGFFGGNWYRFQIGSGSRGERLGLYVSLSVAAVSLKKKK